MRSFVPLALLLLPAAAAAHPQDLAYLQLQARGDAVEAALDIGAPVLLPLAQLPTSTDLTPAGIAGAAPALFAATLGSGALTSEGQPCTWAAPEASIDGMRIRIRASAICERAPGKLHLTLPFMEQTAPTFQLIGRAELDGLQREFHGGPGREEISLEGPPPSSLTRLASEARGLLAPGAGLLALFAALALALAGTRRERGLSVAALLGAVLAGAAAARLVALAPEPTRIAAGIAVFALAAELAWVAEPTHRWRFALPAGLVLGLAIFPEVHGAAVATTGLVGLGAISLLAIWVRWPRPRALGAVLAFAVVAVVAAG